MSNTNHQKFLKLDLPSEPIKLVQKLTIPEYALMNDHHISMKHNAWGQFDTVLCKSHADQAKDIIATSKPSLHFVDYETNIEDKNTYPDVLTQEKYTNAMKAIMDDYGKMPLKMSMKPPTHGTNWIAHKTTLHKTDGSVESVWVPDDIHIGEFDPKCKTGETPHPYASTDKGIANAYYNMKAAKALKPLKIKTVKPKTAAMPDWDALVGLAKSTGKSVTVATQKAKAAVHNQKNPCGEIDLFGDTQVVKKTLPTKGKAEPTEVAEPRSVAVWKVDSTFHVVKYGKTVCKVKPLKKWTELSLTDEKTVAQHFGKFFCETCKAEIGLFQ